MECIRAAGKQARAQRVAIFLVIEIESGAT